MINKALILTIFQKELKPKSIVEIVDLLVVESKVRIGSINYKRYAHVKVSVYK